MSKALVLYYSLSGCTKQVAEMLAELTGAEISAIELENPYTTMTAYTVGMAHNLAGSNPTLKVPVNISAYDVIFLGTPTWFFTASPPVAGVLRTLDWHGKTLVPFSTNRGQNGKTFTTMETLAQGANVLAGHAYSMVGRKDKATLKYETQAWLNSLNLAASQATES